MNTSLIPPMLSAVGVNAIWLDLADRSSDSDSSDSDSSSGSGDSDSGSGSGDSDANYGSGGSDSNSGAGDSSANYGQDSSDENYGSSTHAAPTAPVAPALTSSSYCALNPNGYNYMYNKKT